MQRFLKWWRGRRWTYLGYTELVTDDDKRQEVAIIHFYVWENNNKRRRVKYEQTRVGIKLAPYENSRWYQSDVVPWLEGADMWKPITKKIATKGDIINFVGNQP